ncbi:hypothetical protein PoB_007479600 [Plakobranchus ocellatus]|uniref:Uncharacterized protein n=1 Tax=Plakobranchus ocellatus TaxID=259542 RepID=A0AAV4DVX9_9GAST|nr:hypothetical protein PoB_007479600 [Plakobranchus ocellatus]
MIEDYFVLITVQRKLTSSFQPSPFQDVGSGVYPGTRMFLQQTQRIHRAADLNQVKLYDQCNGFKMRFLVETLDALDKIERRDCHGVFNILYLVFKALGSYPQNGRGKKREPSRPSRQPVFCSLSFH